MRKILSLVLFVCCVYSMHAQNISITGNVKSADDQIGLPGVNVIIKNSNAATVTDFDGNFKIDIPVGSIIEFSYLGFQTQSLKVTSNESLSVLLNQDVSSLNEVIVVGYGTQTKKEITGAVSVVNSETIEAVNPTRIEQALQGQVAGVNITTSSGSPGGDSNIRIRGVSTNGDNKPLILVDGARVEDLSVVNPNDIESISVLKDATAGIYGVLAANGVILITTKTGKKNRPIQFSYDAYGGFQQTTKKLDLLNATEYAVLANEAAALNGNELPFTDISNLGSGTDWQDEVFQNAHVVSQNFGFNGGTEKTTYAASASLLSQDGIVGGSKSNFTRYTTRLNFTYDILQNLTAKGGITYTGITKKKLGDSSINDDGTGLLNGVDGAGLGTVLFNAINFAPTDSVRDENGDFTSSEGYPIEVVNPIYQIENTFNQTKIDKLNGFFGLNYEFLDNFNAQVNYQWNYAELREDTFLPEIQYGNSSVFDQLENSVTERLDIFRDYTFDAFLDYENTFNETHHVKGTLGTSVFATSKDRYGRIGRNLTATNLSNADVDNAEIIEDTFENVRNREFEDRLLSYFGRIQYDYEGRYLLSLVGRRDGSSKFGPENRFGYFGSISGGWIISDESFFESYRDVINLLKIRGSVGTLGNDRIPAFGFVSVLDGEGSYVFDEEVIDGVAVGPVSNPEIKWEIQETWDLGLDLKLFNNKVDIAFDYYERTTKDLLLQAETSQILGTDAPGSENPIVNAGSISNKGVEFQISYRDQISDNLKFSVSYNLATLDNEVLSVNNGIGYEVGGSFGIGQDFPARMQVGEQIGAFYGLVTDGVIQTQDELDALNTLAGNDDNGNALSFQDDETSTGDLKYKDLNGDGRITEDDRTFIGNPLPEVTMGFNITVDYKNFDFQTYLFASIGNDIVRNYNRFDSKTNQLDTALDRWTGAGSTNTDPRIGSSLNDTFSDYFVEDGSFLRAQNMQLGYTFKSPKIENMGITKLRFYVSVTNAFTITKYNGFDPSASNGNPIGGGFDSGFYPSARTFLVGTNFKF